MLAFSCPSNCFAVLQLLDGILYLSHRGKQLLTIVMVLCFCSVQVSIEMLLPPVDHQALVRQDCSIFIPAHFVSRNEAMVGSLLASCKTCVFRWSILLLQNCFTLFVELINKSDCAFRCVGNDYLFSRPRGEHLRSNHGGGRYRTLFTKLSR